jgi:hypothetical protein
VAKSTSRSTQAEAVASGRRWSIRNVGDAVGALLSVALAVVGGTAAVVVICFSLTRWWGALIIATAIAVGVVLGWKLRAGLWIAAGLSAVASWVGAFVLSGWDIDGTLDDRWDEMPYALIAWGAVVSCLYASVLGLMSVFVARGWLPRAGGLAVAGAGGWAALGIAFL